MKKKKERGVKFLTHVIVPSPLLYPDQVLHHRKPRIVII